LRLDGLGAKGAYVMINNAISQFAGSQNTMKIIIRFVLFWGIFTNTHAFDIDCVASYPEIHQDYSPLVCKAERLVKEGQFKAAEKIYLEAARLDFFESPNFEIYMRIARAQCLDGRFSLCKQTLNSFEQMLDIYVGKKTCEIIENKPSKTMMKAIRVMCGEINENTYGKKTEALSKFEKSYRMEIIELRRNLIK
jgi:hypothetical protein